MRWLLFLAFALAAWTSPRVELARVPDGGIQPQVAVDPVGTVHLVYFKGNPAAGDLFYCTARDGRTFSAPIRVNSTPGSAIAIGNIRGARLALGRNGNVFVLWNGTGQRAPLLFTRLNKARNAFEAERNLIHTAYGLDGGSGLAADRQGRVYVFWHAPVPGQRGEANRRVWLSRSLDDGQTFTPERVVWNQPTGVCSCCSLAAWADPHGTVYVHFRAAEQLVHRDMYLLTSHDHAASFRGGDISPWNVSYCVMSSEAFANTPQGAIAAWETGKTIHFSRVDRVFDSAISNDPGKNQKYPALAANRAGFVLLAWTEGMKWKQGGSLHWQMLDSNLRPSGPEGAQPGVPVWSFIAAYAQPDGNFMLLY